MCPSRSPVRYPGRIHKYPTYGLLVLQPLEPCPSRAQRTAAHWPVINIIRTGFIYWTTCCLVVTPKRCWTSLQCEQSSLLASSHVDRENSYIHPSGPPAQDRCLQSAATDTAEKIMSSMGETQTKRQRKWSCRAKRLTTTWTRLTNHDSCRQAQLPFTLLFLATCLRRWTQSRHATDRRSQPGFKAWETDSTPFLLHSESCTFSSVSRTIGPSATLVEGKK